MIPRRGAACCLAAGGLVAGHVIGYALSVPDAAHRHELLRLTGHGYLPSALWLAAAAAALGALAAVVHGARGVPVWCTPRRLALGQAAAFLLLETLERAGSAWTGPTVRLAAVGVILQVAIGWLSGLLLAALHRAGARFARTRVPEPLRGPRAVRLAQAPVRVEVAWLRSAGGRRGPPVLPVV